MILKFSDSAAKDCFFRAPSYESACKCICAVMFEYYTTYRDDPFKLCVYDHLEIVSEDDKGDFDLDFQII